MNFIINFIWSTFLSEYFEQLESNLSVNKNAVVYSIEKLMIKCCKKVKNFIF